MLAIQGPWGMGDIPPQSKLCLQLLPGLWGGGAGQVLSQKFVNVGPADWDHKLGDTGLPHFHQWSEV